jgi:hypothetical protein
MGKMEQQHLNWLMSEQRKDQKELDLEKKKLIKQIKNLDKKEIFPEPPKLTLWQRLKIALMGQ